MNRKLAVALAAVFALAMTMGNDVAWSQGRGGGHAGGGGGYSRGSGGHGAYSGGSGGHYRGSGGHGGHYYGGSHYGSRHGGHYGGHYGGRYGYYGGYYGSGIYLGSALYWGWPWYGGYPYYSYYPYYPYGGYAVYDPAPTVYVERTQPANPPAEAQPTPENFWYYCTSPEGYYPYVKKCNEPWMRVVPTPPPADTGK